MLWSLYGVLKNDLTILVPNAIGLFAGLGCSITYNTYSCTKHHSMWYTACSLLALGGYLFYNMLTDSLGTLSCVLTVVVMGSPLSSVLTVISSKSTASLPLGTSLFMTLNSASWSAYGWLVAKDVMVNSLSNPNPNPNPNPSIHYLHGIAS